MDAPFFQFGRVNKQLQLLLIDINEDAVARLNQSDQATRRGLGRHVTDRDAGGAAGETSVCDEGALGAQTATLYKRGGVEHFLHAGTTRRTLVADHHDIALLDRLVEDLLNCFVLRFNDEGVSFEPEQ